MESGEAQRLDRENPWPGLMPFSEAAQEFFHGREANAAELARRVRRELLTVLFGKSGLGKTSLLNAGLFPLLRAGDFLPVYLRLDFQNAQRSPVEQIAAALADNLAAHQVDGRPPAPGETLWGFFHDKQTEFWSRRNRLVTPVLVFDQFEEIFTLGQDSATAQALAAELAALIENRPPEVVREALERDPDSAGRYDFAKEACKVVIALREDFLPELEGLQRQIPSIMNNRMRLMRMNGLQAREVILRSGGHLVDEQVAERIIAFVAASHERTASAADEAELAPLEIEPALLSIVCRELNNKRRRAAQDKITPDLLDGAQEEIVADFYASSLAGLDPAVQFFIEDELLTAGGYRDSRPLADALMVPGVTRAAIDTLVARRLLRIEERFGTQWIELTHDLLTEVIRQRRDQRREAQEGEAQRERAERAEAEAAAQAALAREAAEREAAANRLVRRTRNALVAVLAMLVVAIGAMVYAVREQSVANSRADEAKKNYDAAIDAAKVDVDIVDRHYKRGEIGTETARALLDSARQTFSGLPGEAEDPATAHARIMLFAKFVEMYLALGDVKNAREAAETERQLADRFAAAGPAAREDVATSHMKLGDALTRQGDLSDALTEYRAGLVVLNDIAAADTGDPQWRRDLAEAHRDVGGLLGERGDLAGALVEFRTALAISTALAARDTTKADWRRDVVIVHDNIAVVLVEQGQLNEAVDEDRAALTLAQALADKDPADAESQQQLGVAHAQLGDALKAQGDLSGGLKEFQAAMTVESDLAASDPANSEWQKEVAGRHDQVATVLVAQGDMKSARREYEAGLAIMRRLTTKDPENTIWQVWLQRIQNRYGGMLKIDGDTAGAYAAFKMNVDILAKITAEYPSNLVWRRDLAASHGWLASALAAQGKLSEALAENKLYLEQVSQLAALDPADARTQSLVADAETQIGLNLKAQSDNAGALGQFRASLAIITDLGSRDPSNSWLQQEISYAHMNIGDCLVGVGNRQDALQEYREARDAMQGLTQKDPTNIDWQRGLARMHVRVGLMLLAGGNKPEAHQEFVECGAVLQPVVASSTATGDVRQLAGFCAAKAIASSDDGAGTGDNPTK
jgi:tetratricopeptide (TPR) repeat protein